MVWIFGHELVMFYFISISNIRGGWSATGSILYRWMRYDYILDMVLPNSYNYWLITGTVQKIWVDNDLYGSNECNNSRILGIFIKRNS